MAGRRYLLMSTTEELQDRPGSDKSSDSGHSWMQIDSAKLRDSARSWMQVNSDKSSDSDHSQT